MTKWILPLVLSGALLSSVSDNPDELIEKINKSIEYHNIDMCTMYVACDALNVRVGPGTEYDSIMLVYRNNQLQVDESTLDNEWVSVYIDKEEYFVHSDFISNNPIEISEPPCEYHKYYSVNGYVCPYEWQDFALNTCRNLGIEWYYEYFICQMYQESKFNPYAVASDGSGCCGLVQLNPSFANEMATLGGTYNSGNLYDPYNNINIALHYMRYLLTISGGNIDLALSKYFHGASCSYINIYPGQVKQHLSYLLRVR